MGGDDLVRKAGWSEDSLETCKSLLDLGLYVSVDMGVLIDFYGRGGQEWLAALLSALFLGLGWFLLASLSVMSESGLSWLGQLAFLLIGHGLFVAVVAPLRANSLNFGSKWKGTVDGFILGGFGVSSAIFSHIYDLYEDRITSFLLMLGCLAVAISSLSACLTKRMPLPGEEVLLDERHDNDQVSPWALPQHSAFWRLWFLIFFSGGANIFFVQSAKKLSSVAGGMPASEIVTWFCMSTLVGRFGGGWVGDIIHCHFHSRFGQRRCGRILLGVPSGLLMSLAAALVVSASSVSRWRVTLAAVATGLSEGLIFACWPGTTRDRFGGANFCSNFSVVNTSLGVGATFYLKAFKFEPTLYIIIVLSFVSALLSLSIFFCPVLTMPPRPSNAISLH